VQAAFGELDLDYRSLQVVSNIFRVATAVRNHMEQAVLGPQDLSWSAFVVLFVLRIWGGQESRHLAAEAGVSPATLTGVVDNLVKRGYVVRKQHAVDGRRIVVEPTRKGRKVIDTVMPAFNREEAAVTDNLSDAERERLAQSLRTILRTVEALDEGTA
jgi:MarR family transcriptional regulator, organic hydroperoxide resistance regulator